MSAPYAVIGATSWGSTLAALIARGETDVLLVTRSPEEAAEVEARRGIDRVPGLVLPENVRPVAPEALPQDLQGLVVAVPAQAMRQTLDNARFPRNIPLLSATKGLEHNTLLRMTEVAAAAGWTASDLAVLSGPNLAKEIARGLPAAAVVASSNADQAARWQRALSTGAFRVYRSDDVVGVEAGGALKNVVAIAAGAADGLGFGANTIAAIMTRGLAEMTRLGVALGARPITFQGLAGVGDLAATCFSPLSRNRSLGSRLGRGEPAAEALAAIGETVEGAATAPVAVALAARVGVEMPIAEQVAAVLAGQQTVHEAVGELLGRTLKEEASGIG